VAKYAGKKGVAYLSTTGGGVATTVLGLNEWSLNMPTDRYEVSEFGDSNKEYVQGLADVTGTLSGFFEILVRDSLDRLFDYGSADRPGGGFWLIRSGRSLGSEMIV
jgi:hypothetical protein